MNFGDKLKQYRTDNDLSLDELADILGTSKQALSRYELNQRTPKITVAVHFAKSMGVPVSNLIDDNRTLYQEEIKMAANTGVTFEDLSEESQEKIKDFIKFMRSQENSNSD